MEIETKLKILNAEFSQEYNRNPFESIKSRLKSATSIYEKLERKGYPITVESIREHLDDVAGVRVICSFPDDIYRLADLLVNQGNMILIREKDYIKNPKPNGYRSLHLILNVKYKKNVDDADEIVGQLKVCSDAIEKLDYQMQEIRNRIDRSKI